MNILSAGEIDKGMYVTVLEGKFYRTVTDHITNKPYEELAEDKTPWYRGIPFKVINVNGPMIAVDTSGLHKGNFSRVMFFDTRYHQLMETTKEFHDEYVELMQMDKPRTGRKASPPSNPGDPIPIKKSK